MKINIFLTLILAMASLFFIACGDSNVTVKNKNCANACDKTWQQCNEETQKCEAKEGFCAGDDACKSDSTKPKCNTETHLCVADKCSDDPCATNTDAGNTVCKLDASAEGFSCVCEEGFELKDNKCVEATTNLCDSDPCKDNADGKTVCKVDETAENGYTCEAPVVNPCDSDPCKDNADGKTVCKVDETAENGYTCETPVVNPCDSDPCKDNADGKTVCKVDETAENGYTCEAPVVNPCDSDPCKDNADGKTVCEQSENADGYTCVAPPECNNTCTEIGATKCTGDRLVKCVKDVTTYCTVWQDTTDAEDCGAGLCTDNNDGAAYCECQECNPDTFNSTCGEDLKSFEYCDNTDGCFTIKTITCEGAKHCEANANGNLECIDNTCTDDPACSSIDDTKCASSGGSSILQGCKINSEGCLELYTITDCSANNMNCSEYENNNICLGGTGNPSCQNSGANNADNEILMSGIWVGDTKNENDDYQGCSGDNFDGQDTVYLITVEQGANLNLTVKKISEESSAFKVSPSIYVTKGSCANPNNSCKSSQAENSNSDASTSLSLTNMDAGTYHIIVDSDKAGNIMMGTYDTYKYELTVNLQ